MRSRPPTRAARRDTVRSRPSPRAARPGRRTDRRRDRGRSGASAPDACRSGPARCWWRSGRATCAASCGRRSAEGRATPAAAHPGRRPRRRAASRASGSSAHAARAGAARGAARRPSRPRAGPHRAGSPSPSSKRYPRRRSKRANPHTQSREKGPARMVRDRLRGHPSRTRAHPASHSRPVAPPRLWCGGPHRPASRGFPSLPCGRCASLRGVPPALRRPRPHRARLRVSVVLAAFVLTALGILGIAGLGDRTPGGVPTVAPAPGGGDEQGLPDPFAWDPGREDEFVRRAATGTSHLLYTLSPGGAEASAERVERWRPLVEAAARAARVDPDTLEGLVFLESAGRDDAVTPNGVEGAVGLTQIVAGTATDLLGMTVDTKRSARLGRRIDREAARGHEGKVQRLRAKRARIDERFDGAKALAATGRYLKLARETFGREDLAFVSYHMGIGNLEGVLRAFSGQADDKIAEVVADEDLGWPEVYFDSSFARHATAYGRLIRLGDDSSNYYWK